MHSSLLYSTVIFVLFYGVKGETNTTSNKTIDSNETKELLKDEKMKGFLKLYTFALKHGKLNLSETLQNLTTLNTTAKTNTTKLATNATAVKLPSKGSAKLMKKPSKDAAAGSGDGDDKKNTEEWTDEYDDDDEDGHPHHGNGNYGNSYGDGKGYEYTNDNGDENGQGYQYQYDNSPMGGSQMGGGSMGGTQMGGGSMGGVQMDGASMMNTNQMGAFPDEVGQEISHGFGGGGGEGQSFEDGQNPSEYNQGFVNFDDGATQYIGSPQENFDKKFKTHKNGKSSRKIKHHKRTSAKHYIHSMVKKMKKHVVEGHVVEGKAQRRTIMIGNRVCGSKKSTNIHTRDEIHNDEHEDNMVKRDTKNKRDIRSHADTAAGIHATDLCCADHYECPRTVPAKTTKFGYANDIEYDVVACACDTKFRNCLKNANSFTADAVGHLYFNTLKIPCLTFEHESADSKSDQPILPQDSSNVVSVVPDAETERETVGGAQLVIPPQVSNQKIDHNKEFEEQMRREQQKEQQKVSFQKDNFSDEQEWNKEQEKKHKPNIINPNPSPNNLNPKLRGVVTLPEAYSPRSGM